jgi:magnesium-protoporphyrin IX monomethyl ester (oxidative) cyclase
LRLTSEISRQVFPLTLDLDNPRFQRGLERLSEIGQASAAAKARGGLSGRVRQAICAARASFEFLRLYFIPAKPNRLPPVVRLEPIW